MYILVQDKAQDKVQDKYPDVSQSAWKVLVVRVFMLSFVN